MVTGMVVARRLLKLRKKEFGLVFMPLLSWGGVIVGAAFGYVRVGDFVYTSLHNPGGGFFISWLGAIAGAVIGLSCAGAVGIMMDLAVIYSTKRGFIAGGILGSLAAVGALSADSRDFTLYSGAAFVGHYIGVFTEYVLAGFFGGSASYDDGARSGSHIAYPIAIALAITVGVFLGAFLESTGIGVMKLKPRLGGPTDPS